MYNRYIPGNGQDCPGTFRLQHQAEEGTFGQTWFRWLGEPLFNVVGEAKNAGIAGILKGLGMESLDSGDVLLLLILLFVFLEGDHTELVITLGLMLLLGGEEGQDV